MEKGEEYDIDDFYKVLREIMEEHKEQDNG